MWLFICMAFLLTSTHERTYEWMWDRSGKWDFHCGMSSCLQYRIITIHMHRDFCDSWCWIFQDCLRHSWQKDLAKNSVKQTSCFDVDYASLNLCTYSHSHMQHVVRTQIYESITFPKFNIAPEKLPSQNGKYSSLPTTHFLGANC